MRTLRQIRIEIEESKAEYRRISALNRGVIKGANDTAVLQERINEDMAKYNSRSRQDHYIHGRLHR